MCEKVEVLEDHVMVSARSWSSGGGLCSVVAAALLVCGCASEQSNKQRGAWTIELADLHFEIAAFWLHLDTLRDAIDLERATVASCDPDRTSEPYHMISDRLVRLIQRAEARQDESEIIAILRNVQASWSEMRVRQTSRWLETSTAPGIDPKERCMRPSGLADLRLEIETSIREALRRSVHAAK